MSRHPSMKTKQKESYVTPAACAIDMEFEGVVCASGGLTDYYREEHENW